MADLKRKFWKCLLYPDSMPDDWETFLDELGIPLLLSPLHDKDVNEKTGEVKKPHYHLLMQFDGPTAYSLALELVKPLGVKKLEQSISRRRDERYWCHLDSPSKFLYDVADMRVFGSYEVKFLEDSYEYDGITALTDLCEKEGIIYYADLAAFVFFEHREFASVLLKYPAHWNNYCYSRERLAGKVDNGSYVKSRRKVGIYARDV